MQSKPKGLKKHINNINKPAICQTNLFYSLPAQKQVIIRYLADE